MILLINYTDSEILLHVKWSNLVKLGETFNITLRNTGTELRTELKMAACVF